MSALAPTLQAFFTDYLITQRAASAHTIAAYRDTFRLLLGYAHKATGTGPVDLDLADLGSGLVAAFLTDLEEARGNSARTRNARLAAIRSFFRYAALRHPEHADDIARVMAVAAKRTRTTVLTYLSEPEVDALLAAPDRATWTGRRDHLMILLLITTGLRVSELTSLRRADASTTTPGAHVACHGKGRKDRITPIDQPTTTALAAWLAQNPGPPTAPLLPARGTTRPMSTDAVAERIRTHTVTASTTCASLTGRRITPHTMRHTTAMRMLAAGIDTATIALWLGHASPLSTRPYLHADLALKQRALDRTAPPATTPGRYTPPDDLLAFLERL